MNPFTWLSVSLRQRGPIQTLQVVGNSLLDLSFDWWHGTDTMSWVPASEIDTSSPNKQHSERYQASKARPLLGLFRKLQWPADSVFVDFGSGKGRVLLLAAQLPVKRVVGIEFSTQLCAMARRNVEVFRRKHPQLAPIDVVESDVTTYRIREDENVFFMYNPFASVVVEQVLRSIQQSVRERPRPLLLIYNAPLEHETVDRSALFTRCDRHVIGGNEFRVYAS